MTGYRVGESTLFNLDGPADGVYLVNAAGTNCYKVGYSSDIPKRIASLSTGNHRRTVLAAWIPGAARAEEAELHAKLARFRTDGEWFELAPLQLALLIYERKFVATDAFSHLDEIRGNEELARAVRMQLMGLDPVAAQSMVQARGLAELTAAVRAIAHGDVNAPGGLEGLAMAIAGTGLAQPLSSALDRIADQLEGDR